MISKFSSFRNPNNLYILLYLAGLLVVAAGGLLLKSPGYMDAQYYYAGGIQLATGKGFHEPFIWNYLSEPAGLPAPSNIFWMPLVSILSAPGIALFNSFTGARLLLWLLAAFVPVITFYFGIQLIGSTRMAALGAVFALFPAFYTAYMTTTDGFAVYMLLASGFILLASKINEQGEGISLFLGLVAGLLHMTRADGILWLAGGILWIFWQRSRVGIGRDRNWRELLLSMAIYLAGYLTVTSAWYARNWLVFGSLFPPGGNKALWLTHYEDLFVYPAGLLGFSRWWASGWISIISSWGQALWTNLQTAVAVQGGTALTPFILIGMWRLRKHPLIRMGVGMWLLTLFVFTFIFPFQGINGSFFHSGAAFQPLFWALAPLGVSIAVDTIARLRKWQRGGQVKRFVGVLLVIVCLFLSIGLFYQKVVGSQKEQAWGMDEQQYAHVDAALRDLGATPCELVMVNNPPGYYLASGRSALVIPYGDESMLLEAAKKYNVQYLVLDENNAGHLARLYLAPGSYPGLQYLTSVEKVRIYEFTH